MEKDFPVLETDRFIQRQFTENDLENVFIGLSHPEVIKYYGITNLIWDYTELKGLWIPKIKIAKKG